MRLTILYVGDLHGRLDRLPRVFSVVARLRAEAAAAGGLSLLVCTGDTVDRTIPAAALTGGRIALPVLEAMGVQALVPGNHDADWGPAAFARWVAAAHFPVLLANITAADGTAWPGTLPSVLLEVNGLRIGLIGVSSVMLSNALGPAARYSPPYEVVAREAAALRGQGATTIVALSHLGYAYGPDVAHWMPPDEDTDVRLAEAAVDLDAIVGGHTHTVLAEPVRIGRTTIGHAGAMLDTVGELTLELDADGAPTGASARLHPVDARWPIDPTISAVLELALDEADRRLPGA
jgi:2',3'-cyclic-nucleotide 2'-phosphodiesterase (5'-nucleotidase family)